MVNIYPRIEAQRGAIVPRENAMPFTVAYAGAGIKRREFDAYIRLLEKRGIDWSNTARVAEPGTSDRWLYVWADKEQVEMFCAELKTETRDKNWYVRELAAGTKPSAGSLARVVILMRGQNPTANYSLHPHSRSLIHRRFPNSRQVSNISIEWTTKSDFEREHGLIWDHVAMMLTGLSLEQLETLDGYQVYDLKSEQPVFDSQATHAA
jgi:hypothetical protein